MLFCLLSKEYNALFVKKEEKPFVVLRFFSNFAARFGNAIY